jgi:hypothetical protein
METLESQRIDYWNLYGRKFELINALNTCIFGRLVEYDALQGFENWGK